MAEKITAVKGMNDLLPEATALWRPIEEKARKTLGSFGFGEVRTPILEKMNLFVRGVGEGTDIVCKEMYACEDGATETRAGTMVALRPEGTAPAVRAAIEHNQLVQGALVRWFYLGPMFRRERQQKGRYRQFFQVGAEISGASSPQADAELIDAAYTFLSQLDLGKLTLEINSLGDQECRPRYVKALVDSLKSQEKDLCPECQRRLTTNPLRVLDCKDEACKNAARNAPSIDEFLCAPCKEHFQRVLSLLDGLGIPYVVNSKIVRGLDYYTRTVFEFISHETGDDGLGSQSTVCAGGRYDALIGSLGGPETPAVGFAAGLDRLALLCARNAPKAPVPEIFIIPMGDAALLKAMQLASGLRKKGIWADMDLRGGGLKSQMRRADKAGARYVMVIGESELEKSSASLKKMETGECTDVSLDADVIAARLCGA